MKKKSLWYVVVAAAVVAALPSVGSAELRGSFDRTLNVGGPVDLNVKSGSGSITVKTGSDATVQVIGKIYSSKSRAEENVRYLEQNPPIEQNGNTITIGNIDRDRSRDISISYEISVPVATRVVSKTGSGSQTIGDVQGPVDVSSGSGSLKIGDIGDKVEASSGSGSIEIQAANGGVYAKTGSGSIRAYSVSGPFTSSSGSGSVELEQVGPGDVEVETGSGSIEVEGVRGALSADTGSGGIRAEGSMEGEWDLHSSSGPVVVRLPSDARFQLDAKSSSGSIESDHPVTVHGLTKKHLQGEVRGGGALLKIRTSSGSIRIK
jgi:DUF4097 and DUF4098 domain-containing protein YvlB